MAAPLAPLTVTGFEPVRERFLDVAASRPGWSGACVVYVDGEPVVDIWAGPAYDGSQIQAIFSVTKAMGAASLALLSQRGELDYDTPVCVYWPEFAAAGKADVTVRTLVSHQAGLHGLAGDYTLEEYIEHDGLAARLAASAPLWEPGTRVGYHGLTMGTMFRELVRRISGIPTRQFFEQHFGKPNDLDLWIGCPADQRHRISPPTFVDLTAGMPPAIGQMMRSDPVRRAGQRTLFSMFDAVEEEVTMNADLPAVNGYGSARGIARFFAALATGVGGADALLGPATCTKVAETQASGPDAVLPIESSFGLGFMTSSDRIPLGGPGSFGHDGAAGALGFAMPASGVGFGWTSDLQVSMGADPAASELGLLAVEIAAHL